MTDGVHDLDMTTRIYQRMLSIGICELVAAYFGCTSRGHKIEHLRALLPHPLVVGRGAPLGHSLSLRDGRALHRAFH